MDRVSEFANRAYQKVAEPYKKLWEWNKWVAIAVPVIAAIGIPFTAGFAFSGLSFSDYWSAVSGGASSAIATGMELKERVIWECGPGIAVCYIVQPNGWSWNDMESMQTIATMAGKQTGGLATLHIAADRLPIAHFDWFSSLIENPSLILPSRM